MIMKPALSAVVTQLRAGRLPSVLEYGALLRESGFEQAQARSLLSDYQDAIAGRSAEDRCMAALRSFILAHE
jgi:hypothetical protein